MTDTVRETSFLLNRFRDGQSIGTITEQDVRDFIVSFDLIRKSVVYVDDAPFNAVGDGVAFDDVAVKAAISSLPFSGGVVKFGGNGKKYRFATDLSAEINSKVLVIFEGAGDHTYEGNTGKTPVATTFYLKDLTTYLYNKTAGVNNRVIVMDGIYFDGGNGGVAGTTCPGVWNNNDLITFIPTIRHCMFRNFAVAHNNTSGNRAIVDWGQSVWGTIDETNLGYTANGRLFYINGATHTLVRRSEFTVCRECYDVENSQNVVFDFCVFESCTFVGGEFRSQVTRKDCRYENIGTNQTTGYVTGITERNHGLAMPAGALQAAGGIITPTQQLYGSHYEIRGLMVSFAAAGGTNFVPLAWFECVGQATGTDSGGTLSITGKKPAATQLFSSTMLMGAAERGPYFYITAPDCGWSNGAGSIGADLFTGSGNKDYRKVNSGVARIQMNNGADFFLLSIKGGRLVSDIQDFTSAFGAAPGATQFPAGDQWEIGDRIVFPVPVAGGNIGLVCTTAGTAAPTWKTYGAIQA